MKLLMNKYYKNYLIKKLKKNQIMNNHLMILQNVLQNIIKLMIKMKKEIKTIKKNLNKKIILK